MNEPKFKVGQIVYSKSGQRVRITNLYGSYCDITDDNNPNNEDIRRSLSNFFPNREQYLEYVITELQSSFREYQDKMQTILTRLAKI